MSTQSIFITWSCFHLLCYKVPVLWTIQSYKIPELLIFCRPPVASRAHLWLSTWRRRVMKAISLQVVSWSATFFAHHIRRIGTCSAIFKLERALGITNGESIHIMKNDSLGWWWRKRRMIINWRSTYVVCIWCTYRRNMSNTLIGHMWFAIVFYVLCINVWPKLRVITKPSSRQS